MVNQSVVERTTESLESLSWQAKCNKTTLCGLLRKKLWVNHILDCQLEKVWPPEAVNETMGIMTKGAM